MKKFLLLFTALLFAHSPLLQAEDKAPEISKDSVTLEVFAGPENSEETVYAKLSIEGMYAIDKVSIGKDASDAEGKKISAKTPRGTFQVTGMAMVSDQEFLIFEKEKNIGIRIQKKGEELGKRNTTKAIAVPEDTFHELHEAYLAGQKVFVIINDEIFPKEKIPTN